MPNMHWVGKFVWVKLRTIQKNPSIMDQFSEDQRILHVVNLCDRGDCWLRKNADSFKAKVKCIFSKRWWTQCTVWHYPLSVEKKDVKCCAKRSESYFSGNTDKVMPFPPRTSSHGAQGLLGLSSSQEELIPSFLLFLYQIYNGPWSQENPGIQFQGK